MRKVCLTCCTQHGTYFIEEGLKDISIPTPFFSDRLSDNESPFSSSSGINCPNDFFNEQALSDPPNLVACSNGESSSELRYYEDLNLGLSNGKASSMNVLYFFYPCIRISFRKHAGQLIRSIAWAFNKC